jgi:CRP/FNR family transcriptional regulator, polysaccharide utilization system transcription regulator
MKYKPGFHADCVTCQIRNKSMFCNLATAELIRFDERKMCHFFRKGQVIFHEGGNPHGVYCISSGKIKVGQSGQDGKEQIVRMAKEADLLGYRALLSGQQYSATATALTNVEICLIPREVFFDVLKTNSNFSMQIIQLLSQELGKAEQIITDLAQKPVRERMAEALLFLRQTYGLEADDATINISLSREDIANLVGTATETAIRLLSEFKHDGIVSFEGKKIKIENYSRLVRTANIED